MTGVDWIVEALKELGGKAHLSAIYKKIGELRGKSLTAGQEAGVRKDIERCSSDSDNYKGGPDLFYSVQGLRSGYWGLRARK